MHGGHRAALIMISKTWKNIALIICAISLGVLVVSSFYIVGTAQSTNLQSFSSFQEMEAFLQRGITSNSRGYYGIMVDNFALKAGSSGQQAAQEYSTTNVQVAGVDEMDMVKTDGIFIYAVSGHTVYIIRAFPAENATILSEITFAGSYSPEIYVSEDRLVVIGNDYRAYLMAKPTDGMLNNLSKVYFPYYSNEGFIKVYDIANRSNPTLVKDVFINGSVTGSRMVGDYVYIVSDKPAMTYNADPVVDLPSFACNNITTTIEATDVKYVDAIENFYNFITVMAINIKDASQQPTSETFLAGSASTMYVSSENMYLVAYSAYFRPLIVANEWTEQTLIYRLRFANEAITVEASGVVPGSVLDQFSMDEHSGYFRIATTEWTSNGSKNNVFVLNMDMEVVGRIENIAPGERIYSSRFMGDWCYLVTFRQVDPFYVIDLSMPTSPEIIGVLKIPGYSSYLHPLGGSYVIGVGKEGNNLKLSLFDVSNVSDPKEVDKFQLDYAYSDSEALNDHKAFLFDEQKDLLVMPVSWNNGRDWTYSQGAYVFNLTVDGGFALRGVVTHLMNANTTSWDSAVRRSLYIGNTLYTLSSGKLVMNDLASLALINAVELQSTTTD